MPRLTTTIQTTHVYEARSSLEPLTLRRRTVVHAVEAAMPEPLEVVGTVVDGEEPVITLETVGGYSAWWVDDEAERIRLEEALWDEFLRQTEAA